MNLYLLVYYDCMLRMREMNDVTAADPAVYTTMKHCILTNESSTNSSTDPWFLYTYIAFEVIVALMAIIGNMIVFEAFRRDRRLRRLTNYYIVSLAVADFFVGLLGIPFAVLTKLGIPNHFYGCLLMLSVLMILCTVSIFNLVAVSIDRFWAILFPIGYTRLMSKKGARRIIIICWILGTLIGLFPIMGWHNKCDSDTACVFTHVMNYNYLVFLYFFTIIFPTTLMGGFYLRIYCVVIKQNREVLPLNGSQRSQSDTDYRRYTDRRSDVNAAKILFIIIIFFVFCWFPLYTINCIQAFCTTCPVPIQLMDFTIVLSHINSAGNPILYAYHLRDFRLAMQRFFMRQTLTKAPYVSEASQKLKISDVKNPLFSENHCLQETP